MIKAIKIALLYWLQQALRPFCPHPNDIESRRYHAPVCPNCALQTRIHNALSSLCGLQAIYRLRKCDLCFEPLADRDGVTYFFDQFVHSACAEKDKTRAVEASRHGLRRVPEYDLPI